MLLSDKGHVKLTDFGLSRVHIGRGKRKSINLFSNSLYWYHIIVVDLNISDLLSPVVNKNDYHMVRTPGQLLSLTSHLSFKSAMSPGSDRGQSPVFNTPEVMRDHRAFKENSFSLDLNGDFSVGVSPPRNSDSFVSLKRKHDAEADETDSQVQFKIPRTGLTEIFQFANLSEDSDPRSGKFSKQNKINLLISKYSNADQVLRQLNREVSVHPVWGSIRPPSVNWVELTSFSQTLVRYHAEVRYLVTVQEWMMSRLLSEHHV